MEESKQNYKEGIRDTFWSPRRIWILFMSLFLFTSLLYLGYVRPPEDFPQGHIVTIERGSTLQEASVKLKEKGVIRSLFFFRNSVRLLGGERSLYAGDYYLRKREGVFQIAYRVTFGKFGLTPVVVQIPEGFTVKQIAERLAEKIDTFDKNLFVSLAQADEGRLFPDTYHFLPNSTSQEVYEVMKVTFSERIQSISPEIESFGRPLEDVIIMASLLEREASELEIKQRIAGVLWKRLEIGMPLQVDAVFFYILGKEDAQVTLEELEVDSPYNTYKYQGLPPGAISNPGLDSLYAAVTPIKEGYLYYLADRNGTTHFSKTFEEHMRNKSLYIN